MEDSDNEEKIVAPVVKAPKSKKDRKKKKDDDLEEAQRELERMNEDENNLEEAVSFSSKPTKKEIGKTKSNNSIMDSEEEYDDKKESKITKPKSRVNKKDKKVSYSIQDFWRSFGNVVPGGVCICTFRVPKFMLS